MISCYITVTVIRVSCFIIISALFIIIINSYCSIFPNKLLYVISIIYYITKVEISYVGYQTAIYKGINLLLGENYVINVSLKESSELLDEVVVTASKESNMKSDRAGANMNDNRDMISNTQTISRSISDIMRLSPQGADVGNGFAVGGGNYRQSFVTVDGAAFNNTFGLGGNLPANGSPISLDALEQVTVAVTPFDVRQSGFTGGAINAVTRSGDNQFRGTAYMYFNKENL